MNVFYRSILSLSLAFLIAARGYKRKSLDWTGAVAGFLTGFITFFCGFRLGTTLILFFVSSSILTKFNQSKKARLESEFKEGGQRNWIQVFCNSGPATISAILYYTLTQEELLLDFRQWYFESFLLSFFLGWYACCNGDTWASELGILSSTKPVLITTWKTVHPGTNGGISPIGTLASLLGGAFIGITFWICGIIFGTVSTSVAQWPIVILGSLGGLIGSLIDSLLGATLQYSCWSPVAKKIFNKPEPGFQKVAGMDILTNNQVNLISATITGFLIAVLSVRIL